MSCDGKPGDPGVERVGDEIVVCTGCHICKPRHSYSSQLTIGPSGSNSEYDLRMEDRYERYIFGEC